MVNEPSHAQGVEFLIKELDSQLSSQQGHVLNDGETHSPFSVTGQLHDRRQKRLRELLNSNNFVDTVEVGNNVEAHFRAVVLQLQKEKREKMLDGTEKGEDFVIIFVPIEMSE
jgi:hypothetical protein